MRGRSTATGKDEIFGYIIKNFPQTASILDVGFGLGMIGRYLNQYWFYNVDGIDIYGGELEGLGLENIYKKIIIGDINNFKFEYYDIIILGDILEHIELEESKKLLEKFIQQKKCSCIIISIPYMQPMKSVSENPYDAHLQGEVNRKYMEKHFPYMKLVFEGEMKDYGGTIGIYIWREEDGI